DQGVVTMGEVVTVLPFQNTLATFQLGGKDIVASLEHGVSGIEEGKGQFPQVAGLKFAVDTSVAPNAGRVKHVQVMESGAWTPIDPAKTYLVATNNFVRAGGDGYKLFADNATNAYDYGPGLEQVVADYLAAHRPYTPVIDGRITEVAAAAPAEPAPAPAEPAPAPAEVAPAEPDVTMPDLPKGSDDIANTPPAFDATPPATEPAPAEPVPAPAEVTPPANPGRHTVVAGDNYWDLAKRYYGDGSKWHLIAEANPEYAPKRLPLGAELVIPQAK
ncbi:MAG: 5'-nucleotidase C-terminal domain-containing protein, partial [Rhizobiaceae bacterium]